MANTTTIVLLEPEPLITTDAAALTAAVFPRAEFQPSFILRTNPETAVNIPIAANGDRWRVLLAPPSAMPDYSFYPIAMTTSFLGGTTQDFSGSFWNANGFFTIDPPIGRDFVWKNMVLGTTLNIYNGTLTRTIQPSVPVFSGFPPAPVTATDPDVILNNSIGGFQFIVSTFVEIERAAMRLYIDARWLAFPRSVTKNAAYYVPRLYFKVA